MDADRVLHSLASGAHEGCIVHLERIPARDPMPAAIDLAPELTLRLRRAGIDGLWTHQAEGLRLLRTGRNIAIATGTASGKSLIYQLATFERVLADPLATALYLFPTKALTQDQLRHLRSFALPATRAAVYDGDTPRAERSWVRRNANVVLTNPDMLGVGILPQHDRWGPFLRHLSLVVVDEMHHCRGVFGSHVANVLRRLRRLVARHGGDPRFAMASATIGNPAELAERLTGAPFSAITDDGSPRGEKLFALWNPPHVDDGRVARASAGSQAAALLAGLVRHDVRTIAFARSRKAAELIASHAREVLAYERGDLGTRVAAYRAGYLPEERRELERTLSAGELLGVAATSALELGIDIGGLDACVLAGYPGTIAATHQQAGRAGRARQRSLAILIAQDDPLDQYLLAHPGELFGKPHEAAVCDPSNPSILDAHLAAAAFEMPLSADDHAFFGPALAPAIERLTGGGHLRARGDRHHFAGRGDPARAIDMRAAGRVVQIVEDGTGRLLGTTDEARAPSSVHPGAIYLHQGEQFEVRGLDLDAGVALVVPADSPHYTQARDVTDIRIARVERTARAGRVDLHLGEVEVTNQVVSFVRKRLYSGETIDEHPLAMPEMRLRTVGVWYTVAPALLRDAGLPPRAVPGAAHAAEHAAIGLMPLFAMCDRWDIGGVSTAEHPDTGMCTVFIYDGYPGGAGFSERSFLAGEAHLTATMDAIAACRCDAGCPSCVQSPKCGNGNEPLDKHGAARMLAAILGHSSSSRSSRSMTASSSPAARPSSIERLTRSRTG